jgi:hypothetical protein
MRCRIFNVTGRLCPLSNQGPENRCRVRGFCGTLACLPRSSPAPEGASSCLVRERSFPHLWKTMWKIGLGAGLVFEEGPISRGRRWAKVPGAFLGRGFARPDRPRTASFWPPSERKLADAART